MGLDNFWKLPEGAQEPTFDPPLHLVGGMLSGNGEGSFRGKCYDRVVENITGISLYTDEIPNVTVRAMATAIEGACDRHPDFATAYDISQTEWNSLRRMFRAYADAGAALVSWY